MMNINHYAQLPSQLIRQRYSCRTYHKRPLDDPDLRKLEDFIRKDPGGPLGTQPRFAILPASRFQDQDLPKLGTYGFIKDPSAFLIGIVIDQPGALVDLGYNMEHLILKATDLEIGSCWLGASFTKSRFAQLLDLEPGESIPAIASLGYPSDQQAWFARVARIYAGADRREPWEELFFKNNWEQPLTKEESGDFSVPLQAVRLAPSASNKQPWRLLQEGDQWHFYLDRRSNATARIVGDLLQIADLPQIDIGIAAAHFALGLQEAGLGGEWLIADPDLRMPEIRREYIISWKPISE